MCKKFKEVTGRENKGNVGMLKGLLKDAVDRNAQTRFFQFRLICWKLIHLIRSKQERTEV